MYYEEALELSEKEQGQQSAMFTMEAAYNLQLMYAVAGNYELSMYITQTYLCM
jgi:hypothetical protein